MTARHPGWFAELRARSAAPDFHLKMTFEIQAGSNLVERAGHVLLMSFRTLPDDPSGARRLMCADDAEDYVMKKRLRYPASIFICLGRDSLEITRYDGGHALADYADEEMRLIDYLLNEPDMRLLEWSVASSGDESVGDLARKGSGKDSFLAYLKEIDQL